MHDRNWHAKPAHKWTKSSSPANSPHWRVGFLFLVLHRSFLLPLLLPLLLSLTTLTHTHSNTLTHSHITHTSLTHSLTLTHVSGVPLASLWRPSGVPLASLWRPSGVPLASLWRPSGVPWSPRLLRGRRATFCSARGVMYVSGVPLASLWRPLVSAPFAWQACDFLLCKGRDVRLWRPSGVPLASLGLRAFCVAGVRLSALQGAWCTSLASLWRPSGVPWSPRLLRGRRATFCSARGVMYVSGVPLASLWRPLVSAPFAWQACNFLLCKGRDVRLWRPSGVPLASLGLRAFCVAGVRLSALQGAWCTSLASLWRPSGVPLASGLRAFCVAGVRLSALQGAWCTSLASLWRPSGVPWSPRLLRGRRATFCSARGVMYVSGVPLASLWRPWSPRLLRGRRATFCSARGVMYVSGVPRRPSGVPWSPRLLRGRPATFCSARGVMYVSGVPLASLWRPWSPRLLRGRRATFCSARGVMYVSGVPLASLWRPLVSAPFAWQACDFLLCKGRDVRLWRPSGVPLASLGLRAFCVAGVRLSALQGAWCTSLVLCLTKFLTCGVFRSYTCNPQENSIQLNLLKQVYIEFFVLFLAVDRYFCQVSKIVCKADIAWHSSHYILKKTWKMHFGSKLAIISSGKLLFFDAPKASTTIKTPETGHPIHS